MTLSSRLRGRGDLARELAWVAAGKGTEFVAAFALLKVLTNHLGAAGFGEYNLAEAALVLIHAVGIVPVHESFLRAYHGARERGELRAAVRTLVTGYALTTGSVVVIATLLSPWLAGEFEIHTWTACAAGLVFCFDRWRFLGIDYRNIQRKRRASAMHAASFHVALLAALTATVWWRPTPSAALFAYALVAAAWTALGMPRVLEDFRTQPESRAAPVRPLILAFGVPFAAILVLQWFQTFGDRYLIKGLLDARHVGLYVAAYQVSGIPYTLLFRVCHELVVPVAYQRGGDGSEPARLWAADRVVLASCALQLAGGAAMLAVYALAGPRLVVLLTSSEFALPAAMVVALACARWLQHIGLALQPIFALHHRAGTLLAFRVLGAALSLGLCAFGIRHAGVMGAALGGAAAFGVYLVALVLAPGGVWWLIRSTRRALQVPAHS